MGIRHQSRSAQAGFVLPTVTMVILVVVLLTTAIVIRSFDRAKNARNYRVDEAVMAASAPAIERATAKLDTLFADPRLPRSTPSDDALYNLLASDLRQAQADRKFTFPDEVPLKLAYPAIDAEDDTDILDEDGGASVPLEQQETVKTAWRFPVDTDGNGKFDSFTLYSILFRSPLLRSGVTRRTPLEARTPPMQQGSTSAICEGALNTSAKLVSQGGWYKQGSSLKKSFFIYTATVPITDVNALGLSNPGDYENYQGTAGFTALEYQQDRARVPLSNNAVLFEDDLAIATGQQFFLNGSITTNGNLFIDNLENDAVKLYQVSAPNSCFYEARNGKIYIGGNVVNAAALKDQAQGGDVPIDLFVSGNKPNPDKIRNNNQSTKTSIAPIDILNNNQAFQRRINYLVETWMDNNSEQSDPGEVREQVRAAVEANEDETKARRKALTSYFRDRTRRVSFGEVPLGETEDFGANDQPRGQRESLRPPKTWMFPVDPSDGKTLLPNGSDIDLNLDQPPATEPETLEGDTQENYVGDRVLVGNGLPPQWYELSDYGQYNTNDQGLWVSGETGQPIENVNWDKPDDAIRSRFSQRRSLSDVGDKSRDGFWEQVAAEKPKNLLDNVGGLRVITGAGVYERKNSFLPPPTPGNPSPLPNPVGAGTLTYYDDPTTEDEEQYPVVWPDTMPMSPGADSQVYDNNADQWINLPTALPPPVTPTIELGTDQFAKGDLRMRASVVYHYAEDAADDDQEQTPIACVSSYYDPTDETTAQNHDGLPWNSDPNGKSNNGISYGSISNTPPQQTKDTKGLLGGINTETYTSGGGGEKDQLAYQANLVFPNGRFVNPLLRQALQKAPDNRTLSEQSAIDSTRCALKILRAPRGTSDAVIPHSAIKEVAFLDSRQVQAVDGWELPIDIGVVGGGTITYTVPANALVFNHPRAGTITKTLSDLVQEGDLITVQGFSDADLNVTKARVKQVNDGTRTIELDGSGTVTEDYTLLGNDDNQKPWIVDILSGRYVRSLEERQPLEVRATQLDLDLLRNEPIQCSGCTEDEYLLPNSGIIYASRDDALPDLSQPLTIESTDSADVIEQKETEQENNSPFDYLLDPTRRPNGIMLINGERLARDDNESFREVEKGLILATNQPAYIKGDFNPHSQNEFDTPLNKNWGNFYTRTELNEHFACRPGDPRLPKCTVGDTWRAATVIADSMTLLSNDFRFGYRIDGDYDLRNNNYGNWDTLTKRLENGFLANNYVTSREFEDEKYSNGAGYNQEDDGSSYFNNFVTPVQRRSEDKGNEYVMEICRKLPVSACRPQDWYVGYQFDGIQVGGSGLATVELQNIAAEYQLAAAVAEHIYNTAKDVSDTEKIGGKTLKQVNEAVKDDIDNPEALAEQFLKEEAKLEELVKEQEKVEKDFQNPSETLEKLNNLLAEIDGKTPTEVKAINLDSEVKEITDRAAESISKSLSLVTQARIDNEEDSVLNAVKQAYLDAQGAATGSQNAADQANDGDEIILNIRASDLPAVLQVTPFDLSGSGFEPNRLVAGTTSLAPTGSARQTRLQSPNQDQLYARRVAFLRYSPSINSVGGNVTNSPAPNHFLVLQGNLPIVLGITPPPNPTIAGFGQGAISTTNIGSGTLGLEVQNQSAPTNATPRKRANTLWYRDSRSGNPYNGIGRLDFFKPLTGTTAAEQPILVPVLQIHSPQGNGFNGNNYGNGTPKSGETKWIQRATETTFNLIMAVGNTPPRPGEPDGGLNNFPRFIENWNAVPSNINGSLMEFERSRFATAPQVQLMESLGNYSDNAGTPQNNSIFAYAQRYQNTTNEGRLGFYEAPERNWGFDVGLLSQLPDLFSQRFTAPDAGDPNEFFREVGRDDEWIKTLLCAKAIPGTGNDTETPYTALPVAINDRPSSCP
jgi:type II secretory pathway pseudopilin PulG